MLFYKPCESTEREKPQKLLFSDWNREKYIIPVTIQKIFQSTCKKKTGISKDISIYFLRYSLAMHLLENVINLRYIKI